MNKGEKAYNSLLSRYEKKLTELRNFKKKLNDFENRTCESCKHNNNQCVLQTIIYNYDCSMDLSRFCCNKYEPKENK